MIKVTILILLLTSLNAYSNSDAQCTKAISPIAKRMSNIIAQDKDGHSTFASISHSIVAKYTKLSIYLINYITPYESQSSTNTESIGRRIIIKPAF
jgi:hypothetical protein